MTSLLRVCMFVHADAHVYDICDVFLHVHICMNTVLYQCTFPLKLFTHKKEDNRRLSLSDSVPKCPICLSLFNH